MYQGIQYSTYLSFVETGFTARRDPLEKKKTKPK